MIIIIKSLILHLFLNNFFLAAKFLQENGMILHFNDHLRGLNNLFFIDPSWLIDMVALVVTVRQRNPFVKHGYINEDELLTILKKNPLLPEEFIPQVSSFSFNSLNSFYVFQWISNKPLDFLYLYLLLLRKWWRFLKIRWRWSSFSSNS